MLSNVGKRMGSSPKNVTGPIETSLEWNQMVIVPSMMIFQGNWNDYTMVHL